MAMRNGRDASRVTCVMIGITSTRLALFVRILIALSTRTFFQPDEYFQSLEPAYHYVFGYGHLTWEWLAPNPIRSIIYPALNVPLYWVLNTSGLADSVVLGDWLLVSICSLSHLSNYHAGRETRLTSRKFCMVHSLLRRTYGYVN